MGVLSARENAEKVGYQYIGEKTEEASNVIDYNINEEITKDKSAVFNANNDTTTGMANVIPGVNAPKLIAQTSIYGIDYDTGYLGGVKFRLTYPNNVLIVPNDSVTVYITNLVQKYGEWGHYDFKYLEGKGIIIPTQGTYKLECTYFWAGDGGDAQFYGVYDTLVGGDVAHSSAHITTETNETFNIDGKKGQGITFRVNFENNSASNKYAKPTIIANITKL